MAADFARRGRLENHGRIHWRECELLTADWHGPIRRFVLRCPYCELGTVVRTSDMNYALEHADFSACDHCGLTGDGYHLLLATLLHHSGAQH